MNFQELEIANHFYYASIIKPGNTERIKMAFFLADNLVKIFFPLGSIVLRNWELKMGIDSPILFSENISIFYMIYIPLDPGNKL